MSLEMVWGSSDFLSRTLVVIVEAVGLQLVVAWIL